MKVIQISHFEKSHYFSFTVLVLYLAVLQGLLFSNASLWRTILWIASESVALTPRKERRTSWNTLNSRATSLAEAGWSRTWRFTGHHLSWVPTTLLIMGSSFVLDRLLLLLYTVGEDVCSDSTDTHYTYMSMLWGVDGREMGGRVCNIKSCVGEVWAVFRSAQNSCLLSFISF